MRRLSFDLMVVKRCVHVYVIRTCYRIALKRVVLRAEISYFHLFEYISTYSVTSFRMNQ